MYKMIMVRYGYVYGGYGSSYVVGWIIDFLLTPQCSFVFEML